MQNVFVYFGHAGTPMMTIRAMTRTFITRDTFADQSTPAGTKTPTSFKALIFGRWRRVYQHGAGLCAFVDRELVRVQVDQERIP